MRTHALIVGGGTAGHVLPGIAIGRELVARGHQPESIHFVGSERGVERTLVPEAGFDLTVLPGRGIQRRVTRENIGAVIGLVRAFARSASLLRRHRPDVVVALGGYASVPAGVWAILRRVPIVVAEQNAVPGLANTIIARNTWNFAGPNAPQLLDVVSMTTPLTSAGGNLLDTADLTLAGVALIFAASDRVWLNQS